MRGVVKIIDSENGPSHEAQVVDFFWPQPLRSPSRIEKQRKLAS